MTACQPPSLARGRVFGLPQSPVVIDALRVGLDAVGVIVPAQRQRRHREVGPPIRDTESAEVDMPAAAAGPRVCGLTAVAWPAGRPPTSRRRRTAPIARTATSGAASHRGCTADRPGSARVRSHARPPSRPQPSTSGTVEYRAAQRSRSASPAKSATSASATLMTSVPEAPGATRKVMPPSSLIQIAGTVGGEGGTDKGCLSPALEAAHSREH